MTPCFIMKILNKEELQQIESNHLSNIEFKSFMKLYKDYTNKPFSFSMNNTNLSSDNHLRFRKNLLKMTATERIKNINNKIEKSKAQ